MIPGKRYQQEAPSFLPSLPKIARPSQPVWQPVWLCCGCRPAIAASALHPLYCCSRAVDRIDRLWGLDLKSIRYAAGGKEVPVELLVARRASSTSREFGKS